jgi:cadmium resistance protein CadD (predicted permease)
MQFGKSIGTACSSFAITNIDDMFVLVTFFAEAAASRTTTPLKITIGQYLGFTIIVIISMIGFGVSLALPSEPIGFLGLLPILLGIWKLFEILFPGEEEEEEGNSRIADLKSILKVASITVMNGGDNIGTYVPLFSQAKGTEIAVYVVVYYILLGIWCLAAWLLMGQRHVLRLVEKYMQWVIPFLYIGLGIYITVKSDAYPWSIEKIDNSFYANPGKVIMGVLTAFLLLSCIGVMLWMRLRKRAQTSTPDTEVALEENSKTTGNEVVPAESRRGSVAIELVESNDSSRGDEEKRRAQSTEREV